MKKLVCLLLCGWMTGGLVVAADHWRELQTRAVADKHADWGHWGPNADKYSSWTSHSNRLIPLYSFGFSQESVAGTKSCYRSADRLREVYGFVPEETVNPEAEYFDQTDVYRLQKLAAAQGKKCIVLVVFDGMDWQTTRAAAIRQAGRVTYDSGRGSGLHFQDYRGAKTEFGYYVTSPHSEGAKVNVNEQKITGSGDLRGGYDWRSAGTTPWASIPDAGYPIGKGARVKHAYTDSSSSASSLTAGIKTYNSAVNVDAVGRQVRTIAHDLQDQGYAIGVVTSVPISHATPAAAYSHNVDRDDYQDLTRDLIGVPSIAHPQDALPGVDVLIGSGWGETKDKDGAQGDNFVPGNRYLTAADRKAIDLATGGKYRVAERTPGMAGAEVLATAAATAAKNRERLLGFFGVAGGHLPFQTADGQFDPSPNGDSSGKKETYTPADVRENPRLAEMAVAALDVLHARSEKLWLMVEAGDVDWANHANNVDCSIGAVLSGDDAFLAMTQWIEKNVGWDNAALFLTSDHGHYLVLDKPEALAGANTK